MSTWGIIGIIYVATVVSWCVFILCHKDKVMSPHNSQRLNIVFLSISILIAPFCWIMGLVTLFQEKKRIGRENWPQPVPKGLRHYLKKDIVFYHNKSMSLAAFNELTRSDITLEQVYGKKYIKRLSGNEIQ